jgi:hypothetical protein
LTALKVIEFGRAPVETDPDVGSPATCIARTAIGRMVRDFEAAGYLDNLEAKDQRTFASFDPPLVGLRPDARPDLVPAAPLAGHDQTLTCWIDGTTDRLDEYRDALGRADGLVIAARARTTVLDWGHLEEAFASTTVVGPPPPSLVGKYADPAAVIQVRSAAS